MTGFLSKLFGKSSSKGPDGAVDLVGDTLEGIIERSQLKLSFDVTSESDEKINVEVYGEDEELLRDRDGQLLDALQFVCKRVLQHQVPDSKIDVIFDSNGYREQANQALIDLADKLRAVVIEKGKSVYCRALPPKERKIVHQYLAEDGRVKSRSIGDGLYKKIKIYPANAQGGGRRGNDESSVATVEDSE